MKKEKMKKFNNTKPKEIIEIRLNGDPYGGGFEGSHSTVAAFAAYGNSWFYRGDLGARSREFWRHYCRRDNIILRYE